MIINSTSKTFSSNLIRWYKKHGRFDLPWQKDKTPYRVWISEIMLQQTQVSTVIPYYERFLKSFPTVKQLALANIDDVLSHWSGLGYYMRARNLHKTGQMIHFQYNSRFPQSVEALEALPGIGKSTAGAILSFAYQLPATICDGNVKRVLARVFAIDQPKEASKATQLYWHLATTLTPPKNTDLYNQAIMDLGATLCTRTKPACERCPFKTSCQAHALNQETQFPARVKKKANPTKTIHMLIFQNEKGQILFEKRPSSGIWGGLWSFPECAIDTCVKSWAFTTLGLHVLTETKLDELLHKFTHFNLTIKPLLILVKGTNITLANPEKWSWYTFNTPLPGGICKPIMRLLDRLT